MLTEWCLILICLWALNTPCPVIDAAKGSLHVSCLHISFSDQLDADRSPLCLRSGLFLALHSLIWAQPIYIAAKSHVSSSHRVVWPLELFYSLTAYSYDPCTCHSLTATPPTGIQYKAQVGSIDSMFLFSMHRSGIIFYPSSLSYWQHY